MDLTIAALLNAPRGEVAAAVNGMGQSIEDLSEAWGLSRPRVLDYLERGIAPKAADGFVVRRPDGVRLLPTRWRRPQQIQVFPGAAWFSSLNDFARWTDQAPSTACRLVSCATLPSDCKFAAICYGGRWVYRAVAPVVRKSEASAA